MQMSVATKVLTIQALYTTANHHHPQLCEEKLLYLQYKIPLLYLRVFYWVGNTYFISILPIFVVPNTS